MTITEQNRISFIFHLPIKVTKLQLGSLVDTYNIEIHNKKDKSDQINFKFLFEYKSVNLSLLQVF